MNSAIAPPDKRIVTVSQLLADSSLSIPPYQRPYKWTTTHVQQLFADITFFSNKSRYRLGTVVFHRDKSKSDREIVDGQQRIVTLLMIIRALIQFRLNEGKLDRADLKQRLHELAKPGVMIDPKFSSEIARINIRSNYLEISRLVSRSDFTEEHIDFLLNRCEIVTFELQDISEAFQFFDSQNARGRDLDPHDLLKAYHLREFSPQDERLKAQTVANWEDSEPAELAALFAEYLFRVRNWAKGMSARYFSKDDTPLFKGINLETIKRYPYVDQLRIAHHFIDNYNHDYQRDIDGIVRHFPFQIDQIILNGRRFFEYAGYYQKIISNFKLSQHGAGIEKTASPELNGFAPKILETINSYRARNRTGDGFVRMLFDCLLIYYIDKFGKIELSRAIEKIFIWAYSIRLQMQSVQLATVDNYVIENNLFRRLKDATEPFHFISASLPVVTTVKSTNTDAILELFKDMKYYG